MRSKAGAQINQSILDGIAVLQALAGSDAPVGGVDISQQLGMESTRVNRLLKTLASIGMTQQTKSRKYVPGPGIHVLAAQSLYASGLLRAAIPTLERLSRFNLTVAMGVLWFDKVSFIYHAQPGMKASDGIGRIGVRPATASGIGMMLLANTAIESVKEVYENRDIPNFPAGLNSLLIQLDEIRAQQYARFQTGSARQQPHNLGYTIAVDLGQSTNCAIALQGNIDTTTTTEIVSALQVAKAEILRELEANKQLLGL